VIDTLNLGHRSDTYMYLYGTDGETLFAYSDDDGEGLASRIAWTAPRSGVYYVRVRHYSASVYGGYTGYDLQVHNAGCAPEGDEYEDDDDPSRASSIASTGAAQAHTLHDAGDQDWVRFTAEPGFVYTLETHDLESNCDTTMYLYGEDGQTLLAYDDDGGEGMASRIVWASGTGGLYLVRLRHYHAGIYGPGTGYLFLVTEGDSEAADRYEDDDVAARASAIEGLQAGHNLHDAHDHDWVQFSATEGASYVIETLNLEARCDTYLDLFDTDGSTRLRSDDDGGPGLASRIEWTAPAGGTYYVRVRHYSEGAYGDRTGYDLSVTDEADGSDEYEPDDSAGSANPIQVNAEGQTHNFHAAGDHDWVWFQASTEGAYTIETLNLGPRCDTVMVLYRSNGQTEIAANDDGGEGRGSRIAWTADESGWYLVMVRQFGDETHGPHTHYDLRVLGPSVRADAYEPDNIAAQAQALVVDDDAQTHNIHVAGDDDWVRFDAENNEVYTIGTSNLCSMSDTYLYLYDRDGRTLIAADDDGGDGLGSRIEWSAQAQGTYFVRVRHYSSWRYGEETCYDLAVESQRGVAADEFEPDNVYAQAGELTVNGADQRHNFHVSGDYDWVRFAATSGCAYVLETFDLGSRSDTYLYLYEPDGRTMIAYDDDSGGGLGSRIQWTAPSAGTYYAMVRHYSGNTYGNETDYSLGVTTSSCAALEGGGAPGDAGAPASLVAPVETIAWVELPIAAAREGEELEAVVYLRREAAAVKVEMLVKPEYLELVQVVPLTAEGSVVDDSTPDAATRYPDRWQVVPGEDGLTLVWYAGKGEWDGGAAYPVVRIDWRVVAPLPGKMAIPFVVTIVDVGGQVETETVYGIVQPPEDDPPTDEFRIYLPLTVR
jgi:Pyruvate/2-oxoacid:ferredoxin oxidoreductase gamma subunit